VFIAGEHRSPRRHSISYMIRYALLALLRDEVAHGYALVHRLEASFGAAWRLNPGQVYQALQALERAGCIAAAEEDRTRARRFRRPYRLTSKGARFLDRWLRRERGEVRPARHEALVWLLAAGTEGRDAVAAGLARHRLAHEREVARLEEERRRRQAGNEQKQPLRELALEATLIHAEAHLRWLRRCEEVLGRALQGT
jgi:DNA-binding PadR family transcriptional regulator